MRLYIGIARTVVPLLLAGTLLIGVAFAMPLPTEPPEVDSTPVSHEEEPENFREAASLPQEIPQSLSQLGENRLQPADETPPEPNEDSQSGEIGTGSILLMGAVIWYAVTLIGISGGRRGSTRSRRRQE